MTVETMSEPRDKEWAKRICRLMESASVGVEELAAHLGVDRSTVYSWRYGTRVPHRTIQGRLARRLRTSIPKLNGWA